MVCVINFASRTRTELQFRPGPARKLSANLYDIYYCCVYSEKLLMMDRGTVRNMLSFIPKINFEKLVRLVGFITRIYDVARPPECQMLRFFLYYSVHMSRIDTGTNKQLIHIFANEHNCYNKPCTSGVSILI